MNTRPRTLLAIQNEGASGERPQEGLSACAAGLYAECPPRRIYILTPRPSCPPGEYLLNGGKAGGGTADWCWLVWDLQSPHTGTTFHWLRRAT